MLPEELGVDSRQFCGFVHNIFLFPSHNLLEALSGIRFAVVANLWKFNNFNFVNLQRQLLLLHRARFASVQLTNDSSEVST